MSAASTTTAASPAIAAPDKSSAGGAARRRSCVAANRSSGPPLRADCAETKRLATAILEVLAGVRTPADAAKTLEISVSRYYLLETRALGGLVAACESRPKGPGRSVDREIAKLERELAASRRDVTRWQTLLRAAQRAVGLAPPQPLTAKPASKSGAKPARRRRQTARALRAVRAIDVDSSGTNAPDGVQPSPSAGSDASAVQPPTHAPSPSVAVDHGGSP